MNATGRVNRPSSSKAPPTISSAPANQINENSSGGFEAIGKPKNFDRPCCSSNNAATMRRMLNIYGEKTPDSALKIHSKNPSFIRVVHKQ